MAVSVSFMGDLVRSVVAGQYLINSFIPEPPPVQFYNIRLGLGSGQNASSALPSAVVTDMSNTKFFAKFEGVDTNSAASRQGYRDSSVSFSGPRGTHKRINSLQPTEVAVQTSSQSNGFSLKSIDLQGGSDALCISNIVIKGSDTQAPRDEIFIPIGDLGFLCGRRWNWGSILDGNRQRCIWLDGISDTDENSVDFLHIDMQKMGSIFKADKNDELSKTNLETACKFFRNSMDLLGNGPSTGPLNDNQEEPFPEKATLAQAMSDEIEIEIEDEDEDEDEGEDKDEDQVVLGEMLVEDLYEKKQIPVDQKESLIDDQEETEDLLEVEIESLEELDNTRRIAETILEDEEIRAENELSTKQALEEEILIEEEKTAENYLVEQSDIYTEEEMLVMKQMLAENELAAEEKMAERHLKEQENLAEDEVFAENTLAGQALEEEKRIIDEEFMIDHMLAEKSIADKFGADESSKERLEAEEGLKKATIAEMESLVESEDFAERMLDEEKFRVSEELRKEELLAEEELRENKIFAEEELLQGDVLEDDLQDMDFSGQAEEDKNMADQSFFNEWDQEDPQEWFDDEEEEDSEPDDLNEVQFLDEENEEDFINSLDYSNGIVDDENIFEDQILINDLDGEDVNELYEQQGFSDGEMRGDSTEFAAGEYGQKNPINVELKKRVVFAG